MRLVKSSDVVVVTVAGSAPLAAVFVLETVGSDSSSATKGSSVASVAGKKRLPAKPCAKAVSAALKPARAQANIASLEAMRVGLRGASRILHARACEVV